MIEAQALVGIARSKYFFNLNLSRLKKANNSSVSFSYPIVKRYVVRTPKQQFFLLSLLTFAVHGSPIDLPLRPLVFYDPEGELSFQSTVILFS